jgi:hypothetical protein
VEGVDFNPLFTDLGMLELNYYVQFYENLAKKYPDANFANLTGFIQFHATMSKADKEWKKVVLE